MSSNQVFSRSSPSWSSSAKDVESKKMESGQLNHSHGDGQSGAITLRGRPVDKSRTGRTRATIFVHVLNGATWALTISLNVNLVFYVIRYLHQEVSTAATITGNFTGTAFLLGVLGGFLADSILGNFLTIISGTIIQIIGLGIFVTSVADSHLQPPACAPLPPPFPACPPAGGKYTAVFNVGLYTIALGIGLVNASLPALGAEQFDDDDQEEKRESIHFFPWLFFSQSVGTFFSFLLTVYILTYKEKEWAFGYLLILLGVALAIFLTGTPRFRHKRVGGSFLTRVLQVAVAAFRKRRLPYPQDENLYDEPVSGAWLRRSNKLRILDKASIIDDTGIGRTSDTSRWRQPGVTQVEETKRIARLLPVWAPTTLLSVGFATVITFTATQAQTLDRNIGKHFTVPAASLGIAIPIIVVFTIPVYDRVLMPFLKRVTGNPYGISPLKRIVMGCLAAVLAMVSAALVERKRLTYIHRLGYAHLPVFQVPMKMWWLLPQYFFTAMTELFLYIPLYEFYFHEVSDATRSIAVSFLLSALGVGGFFSTVLIKLTNHITKNHHGGAWLKQRLNDGGLENHFWLLSIILGVDLVLLILASYFYEYNYELFRSQARRKAKLHVNEIESDAAAHPRDSAAPQAGREARLEKQNGDELQAVD